jgi:hypothetical protein
MSPTGKITKLECNTGTQKETYLQVITPTLTMKEIPGIFHRMEVLDCSFGNSSYKFYFFLAGEKLIAP